MTMQIFVIVLVVVVFVVSCNWFFPAHHKSVLVLFLFTCILYCIAFLLLREAFLRMRIPSNNNNYYTYVGMPRKFMARVRTCGIRDQRYISGEIDPGQSQSILL